MHARTVRALAFATLLTLAGSALAQTPATPSQAAAGSSQPSAHNQSIERIRVEGQDVQVDELRVGGETRTITVQPRGGLPAYDVQPRTGERSWKLFSF
ncbi:MAG: hypothetical protein RLZZ126_760 [Pseudomonadota bacterium]